MLCNNAHSLIKNINDGVILLKRFFDGLKTIYAVLLNLIPYLNRF
jgi:hypothetical protein